MHPRQIDFTGNFFPPESLGTNVSRILIFLCTFGILPTQRIFLCRTPYSKLSRFCFCTRLQLIMLDFTYTSIIQPPNHLIYKAFDKSNSSCYTLSKIHEGLLPGVSPGIYTPRPITGREGLLSVGAT